LEDDNPFDRHWRTPCEYESLPMVYDPFIEFPLFTGRDEVASSIMGSRLHHVCRALSAWLCCSNCCAMAALPLGLAATVPYLHPRKANCWQLARKFLRLSSKQAGGESWFVTACTLLCLAKPRGDATLCVSSTCFSLQLSRKSLESSCRGQTRTCLMLIATVRRAPSTFVSTCSAGWLS